MKLRSGVPYWRVISPDALWYPTAVGDLRCEVAVVGGGITGALLSHLFVRHGIDTLLLDKRQPGEGSTAASTGLLQYEVDTPLSALIRKVGKGRAVHAYRRGLRAIDELEAVDRRAGGLVRLLQAEEPVLCQPLVARAATRSGNTSAAASTDLTCSCFRGASCGKSRRSMQRPRFIRRVTGKSIRIGSHNCCWLVQSAQACVFTRKAV